MLTFGPKNRFANRLDDPGLFESLNLSDPVPPPPGLGEPADIPRWPGGMPKLSRPDDTD